MERRAYRRSFPALRWLAPADGFCEWEPRASRKQPYRVHRPGLGLFAMAGIRAPRRPLAGTCLATFAIPTGGAPPALGWLHDRVPVIRPESEWDD